MYNSDAVATIDRKIEELEDELRRLREAIEAVPNVEANLAALKRTRLILTGNPDASANNGRASGDITQKSIGGHLIEILQEHGKPMHVDVAMPKLKARGCNANRNTIIGTLVRYMKAGKVRRTKPNTYTIHQKESTMS